MNRLLQGAAALVFLLTATAGHAADIGGEKILLPAKERQVQVTLFRAPGTDLHGSFCTKRIDRNWLGKELEHGEEETDAGADSDAASAD